MKKILMLLYVLTLSIFLIFLVNAGLIGPFKQGQDINLPQTCDDCTYNTITSILAPNSSVIVSNVAMTKNGTYFNYTLSGVYTSALGTYIINGVGDLNGVDTVWAYDFDITPTGDVRGYGFFLILIFASIIIFLASYFFDFDWGTFLSGVLFILSGVYAMIYGIGELTDLYTRGIAIVSIGLGIIFVTASIYNLSKGGKEEIEE